MMSSVLCLSLCIPQCAAAPPSWQLNPDLISSTQTTEAVFTCWMSKSIIHRWFETHQLPSPGLACLSKLFARVWLLCMLQLLGATGQRLVSGGDQSGRLLQRAWHVSPSQALPLPNIPYTPQGHIHLTIPINRFSRVAYLVNEVAWVSQHTQLVTFISPIGNCQILLNFAHIQN